MPTCIPCLPSSHRRVQDIPVNTQDGGGQHDCFSRINASRWDNWWQGWPFAELTALQKRYLIHPSVSGVESDGLHCPSCFSKPQPRGALHPPALRDVPLVAADPEDGARPPLLFQRRALPLNLLYASGGKPRRSYHSCTWKLCECNRTHTITHRFIPKSTHA